jgi:hypothetical protein
MSILGQLGMAAANAGIGGLIGIQVQKKQNEMQLAQQAKLQNLQEGGNKRMADYQQQLAMQMWRDTNYGAQMDELKKAGLNPGLMYGKGGGGGTTANASVSGVSGSSAGNQDSILQGIGLMQQQQQMRLQDAQIKALEAGANKDNADATKTSGVDTKKAESEIDLLTNQAINEKDENALIRAKTYLTELEGITEGLNIDFLNDTYDARVNEINNNSKKSFYLMMQESNNLKLSDETLQKRIDIWTYEVLKAKVTNELLEEQKINTIADTKLKEQKVAESKKVVEDMDSQIKKRAAEISQGWANVKVNERNATTNEDNARTNFTNAKTNVRSVMNQENAQATNKQRMENEYEQNNRRLSQENYKLFINTIDVISKNIWIPFK